MRFHEYTRRGLLPLVVLALALFYLFVSRPLSLRSAKLDKPLQDAWARLAASLGQPSNTATLHFPHLTNQLTQTRQDLVLLENAKKEAVARLELPPWLRDKLTDDFHYADYRRERTKRNGELQKSAKAQQVTLDDNVVFPEYNFEFSEPKLLWPALDFADNLLDAAVRCKVTTIHLLEVALPLTNSPASDSGGHWSEIPLELEFTGPDDSALKLVQSLPLKPAELRAAGLPEARPGKTPLLINRLVIRKQTPEKLDEVRVWLQAVGFVWQGGSE